MKNVCLGVAIVVAAATPVLASGDQSRHLPPGAVLSADGSRIAFTQPAYIRAEKPETRPPALVPLFDNLAEKYPEGRYWPYGTWGVAGPDNPTFGHRMWTAAPFTAASDSTVVRIEVAVKLISGSNHIVLSLRDDNAGVPGPVLQSWVLKNLPDPVTCCGVKTVSSVGIPLSAGHQYWVALSTDADSRDTLAGWSNSVTHPLTIVQLAHNDGTRWGVSGTAPAPAFAVFASP